MKTLNLSDSQHLGWDKFSDERAVLEAKEARFLASCLRELGGKLTDPWQFDRVHRVFWMPDPPQDDAAATPTE